MAKVSIKSEDVSEDEIEPIKIEETMTETPVEEVPDIDFDDDEDAITIESLPPDSLLWENGPTAGEVVEWKKQYGEVYITNVTLEKHVVWRTLKRSEYKHIVRHIEDTLTEGKISQTEANMMSEELTCQVCILFPHYGIKDFDGELAGLPSILSQQINEASGFSTIAVRQL
jgi:hypothetical protein